MNTDEAVRQLIANLKAERDATQHAVNTYKEAPALLPIAAMALRQAATCLEIAEEWAERYHIEDGKAAA